MCTILAYKNKDDKTIIGRNFDWIQTGGSVHFVPPARSYGIETSGMVLFEQMGEYMPYDGINDKGLFVGMAAVVDSDIKPGFKDMNDLGLIRFILERASTAEEALYIAKKQDIYYLEDRGYPKVHYMFADKDNNLIIYEEYRGEKKVQLDNDAVEVITNNSCFGNNPCERKEKVRESFENNFPNISTRQLLEEVKQEELTVYSMEYDLSERSIKVWIEQDFENEHLFNVKDVEKGKKSLDFGTLKLLANMRRNQ